MSKLAYPVVGGPLDGEWATTDDFYDGSWRSGGVAGMYAHLSDQYHEYNRSTGKGPSMMFVHASLLRPTISPRKR